MSSKGIKTKIDAMISSEEDLQAMSEGLKNTEIDQSSELAPKSPLDSSDYLKESSVFADTDPIMVAAGRTEFLDIAKEGAKKIIKERLGAKGARIKRDDIKVTEPTEVIEEPVVPKADEVKLIEPEKPTRIKPTKGQEQEHYEVTDAAIEQVIKQKEEIMDAGAIPKPATMRATIDPNRVSTVPYDDASLIATVESATKTFLKENPQIKTVEGVFKEAERRGIDVRLLEKVMAGKGASLDAKLGTKNAGDLPEKVAGFIKLHDDSAKQLDELFNKYTTGQADDVDKYNLRLQLAYHQQILKGMTNVQTDVAVALNTFKRNEAMMKDLKSLDFNKMDELLAATGNEATIQKVAELYATMPTRAGKNKLIKTQQSFNEAFRSECFKIYKANLLSSPDTMVENFIGATVTGVKTNLDDLAGALWGTARRKLLKQPLTRNDVIIDDIMNGYIGMKNGLLDGLEEAVVTFKTGSRSGYKKDIDVGETMLEALSEKPVRFPFTRQVLGETPKADVEWWKHTIRAASFFPDLILRTLGAGDELAGGLFARMKLHSEASRYARNRIVDLVQSGKTPDQAIKIADKEVKRFLTEQPANLYNNVESAREFINLRYRFADEVKDVDILGYPLESVSVGKAYNKVNNFFSKTQVARYIIPFTNSLTRIFEMTAASLPGLAALSPTYWEDKAAGGARRDRANGRMALGSLMFLGFLNLADKGYITGSGPSDPKYKDTLKNRGRIPYALRLGKSEYSQQNIDSLKKILSEDEVKVSKNGDLYISFERLDNFAMIAGIAGDLIDYASFEQPAFNSTPVEHLHLSALSAIFQFLGNQVWFEQTGRFVTAFNSANERDKGNAVVNFIQNAATFAAQNMFMSVPVASTFYSSMARKFATTYDPAKKTYKPEVMNVDTTNDSEAMLLNSIVQMRQNNALFRGDLTDQYDNLGRPMFDDEAYVDHWLKHVPGIRMSQERGEKIDRIMDVYETGISTPEKTWEGIELSGYQYEMFKKLYGNDIQLSQYNPKTKDVEPMNLRKALVAKIEHQIELYDLADRGEIKPKDIDTLISSTVSEYRAEAKQKMRGTQVDKLTTNGKITIYEPYYINPLTGEQEAILFMDLSKSLNALNSYKEKR